MTHINANGDQPKRGKGRPPTSRDFRIIPIPHANPDARKLGRAFLALALLQAAADAAEAPEKEAGDESA